MNEMMGTQPKHTKRDEIAVIGAGVIGISIALELANRGHAVRVFDRKGVAQEASFGNGGGFAFADIVPLATPGIMRKAPKWLFDPLGPLSVPLSYAPNIAPWMLRFWRASWRDRYAHSIDAQSRLMDLSRSALERQIVLAGAAHLIRRDGQLQLFEGEQEFRQSLPIWDLRERYGVAFDLLESPAAIAEIQPGLHPQFTHAGFTPDWINVTDPKLWVDHLAKAFLERGGKIEQREIHKIAPHEAGAVLYTAEGEFQASKLIIAAGAWSHFLTRQIGDKVPLETERGYNTTLPEGAFDLRMHLTFGGHGFVVTRIGEGVRVGGAVELGGLNRPANFKRAEILLNKASQFMPDLKVSGGRQWMGFRPSLPDSLPVIGESSASPDILYAFGHGHLGLTQSAGTAEVIAGLVYGHSPDIPLDAYSAQRF